MKIRCSTNNIRLRLRKSDINLLVNHNKVEDSLDFPGGKLLTYALFIKDVEVIEASFEDGYILITIPAYIADDWIKSDDVGIEASLDLGEGKILHLLIEKDFGCKDGTDELSDTFVELNTLDDQC